MPDTVEMKGGALSPLPLSGGRRRKTKKVPKKILKLFKKGAAKTLKRLMKGGEEQPEPVVEMGEEPAEGGRHRRSRKGSRKGKSSRRHGFLY